MKHDQGYLFSLLAAICVLNLTGCANKAAQSFNRPPAPVQATVAIAQDVPTYLDAIGKTVAREVVSVQPQVSGRITKINFTDGANVRKGDLLFTIDTRPFEANLKQAQANYSKDEALKRQAEANLAKEVAAAKWGETQVKRYGTLVEAGVVAREQYEEFRANQDSLNANVGAARAAVASANESLKVDAAAIDSAKVELSYCYIRAPIDGRAGQRLVDVGNVVSPGGTGNRNSTEGGSGSSGNSSTGNSNALLVIEKLDPIYADFTISQDKLTAVQEEMRSGSLKTEIRLPDSNGEMVAGQLTFLDNAVQNTTGTVNLRATIPNAGHRFWPGRFVNVRLVLSTIHQAVLIPATAPQMSAKGSFVYVIKADQTAEQRAVTLGQRQQDLIVIESGVQIGELVVTNGQLGVTPNGKVLVEKPREANAPAKTTESGSK
jgi:multidrug efflux system membrane fusion protein